MAIGPLRNSGVLSTLQRQRQLNVDQAKAEIEASGGEWELVEVPGALEVPEEHRAAQERRM